MDIRVAAVILILSTVNADDKFYRTNLNSQQAGNDQNGEKTETHGFVQPIDFSSFSQQFFSDTSGNHHVPFTSSSVGDSDFFGSESTKNNFFQSPGGGQFSRSAFADESENNEGFVRPLQFRSFFDGDAAPSSIVYRPEYSNSPRKPAAKSIPSEPSNHEAHPTSSTSPYRGMFKSSQPGKSNYPSPRSGYKSEHSPPIADSSDVEVFLPRGKLLLPTKNGRPRPYDGYRAASQTQGKIYDQPRYISKVVHGNPNPRYPYHNTGDQRGAQQFKPKYNAEDDEEDIEEGDNRRGHQQEERESEELEEEEDEAEQPGNSGYQYKYDSTVNVPDLVIKRYPYEKNLNKGRDYESSYEEYRDSFPDDLEKLYGSPDLSEYTGGSTENLAKNKNCKKVETRDKRSADNEETCYVCNNPETGGSYEQCAYQSEPKSNTYFYGGSKSSSHKDKPSSRQKRSLDFFTPSKFEYIIYNDQPSFQKREPRQETKYRDPMYKRKTKKYTPTAYKKSPKSVKKPNKYSGYESPSYTYEGPSQTYEGPRYSYEGPSRTYEGPDHDDYYDTTDDRIPYKNNAPLQSSFLDELFGTEDSGNRYSRQRRKPKTEPTNFGESTGYLGDFRFGPEYFEEFEHEDKPEPTKRDVYDTKENEENKEQDNDDERDDRKIGKVTVFKNGDVCEKMNRKGMLCMVCKNQKTDATYEQCQYSTKPTGNNYKYGHESSFTRSNSRPQRHVNNDQSPATSNKVERKFVMTKVEKTEYDNKKEIEPAASNKTDMVVSPTYEVVDKSETAEEILEADEPSESDEQIILESTEEDQSEENDNFPKFHESYEAFMKRVFPEFEQYESLAEEPIDHFSEDFKDEEQSPEYGELVNYDDDVEEESRPVMKSIPKEQNYFESNDKSRENLKKSFDEFKNRDWSKCNKTQKNELICYKCKNQDGTANEECMFVEGVEPIITESELKDKQVDAIQSMKEEEPTRPIDSTEKIIVNNTTDPPEIQESVQRPVVVLPLEEIRQKTTDKPQKGDFDGVDRYKPKSANKENKSESNWKPSKPRKFKKYQPIEEAEVETESWESVKTEEGTSTEKAEQPTNV